MSAVAALKGYRTQFLYSLYYILTHKAQAYSYRLEGEEDLDVLDEEGHIVYAIQVKNLSKTLSLSDLVAQNKTSFLKRFVETYPKSTPILASFGPVQQDLKKWKERPNHKDPKERALFQKAGISEAQITLIKEKVQFTEISEETITEKILEILKEHQSIDPVPTAENLLYYIQFAAEKQQLISVRDLLENIDKIGIYLSERIAYTNQYGIYIKPLIKSEPSADETDKLKSEFYYGISVRYEHISLGLDIPRDHFLQSIQQGIGKHNILIINGASGQGKSTLAYRYVSDKASKSLIYEVSLQEDPVKTNEAITAISGLTQRPESAGVFHPSCHAQYHVLAENRQGICHHPFLRLLVTVRNEDWFRAQSSEIDFLYTDVELELSETEAEVIFNRLEERQLIKTHNDFKDAWLALSAGVPLLEFIHAITQGSSLREKLSAQVAQLTYEEAQRPTGQLDFLRTVCLSDAFGARIDVTLIRDIPNIKLITDKFEKEYLLKHSNDRKYLSGLHPIRSMLLVELLFDEFTSCKKDYVIPSLKAIQQDDAYTFILQALYHLVISPGELVTALRSSGRNSWVFYNAATKALLWAGIREYIIRNQKLLDEVYEKAGDAWIIVTDIYHGDLLDLEEVLKNLPGDNQALADEFRNITKRLTPKTEVYQPVTELFNEMELPEKPLSAGQWNAFAETLFWLSKLPNRSAKINNISKADFRVAFELMDLQSLATLMLGMHYYSDSFNAIRLELAPLFNTKLRNAYPIPLLQINGEVSIDFVVDMTSEVDPKGWHEYSLEIIDLVRTAYPDKDQYRTQGHGHRLDMIPLLHDDTFKDIPAKNLPLVQWVNMNANLRRLVDYPRRPEDWLDFHQQLLNWEQQVKTLLQSFRQAFTSFRKTGLFTELLPVMEQMSYRSISRLAAPKSSVDPLGIPAITRIKINGKQDGSENNETYLSEKYKPFFDSYYAYRSSIENFIRQSGQSCYDAIKSRSDSSHVIKENIVRVSFINLYDAAAKKPELDTQRKKYFRKFMDHSASLSDNELFGIASIWKSFWTAIHSNDPKRLILNEGITTLQKDFVNSLTRAIKAANKNSGYRIVYRNDAATRFLPVFITQISEPLYNILALRECYQLIFECIRGAEYTSLKYMMLQRYFPKIYIISEIRGHLFDIKWYQFPLHLFLDTPFENLPAYRFVTQDIEPEIASSLKLKSWQIIHPKMTMIHKLATDFEQLKLYVGHLADLQFFNNNEKLDEMGNAIIKKHFEASSKLVTATWNDLMEQLTELSDKFPEDVDDMDSEETQEYLTSMLDVMKGLIPKEAGPDRAYFDIDALQAWSDRLMQLNERWGLFILLLQKKVLMEYEGI